MPRESARKSDGSWRPVLKGPSSVKALTEQLASYLVRLVEDRERPLVLCFRRVLEVLNVGTDDLPISNQEPLSVDHV